MTTFNELKELHENFLANQKAEAEKRVNTILTDLNNALVEAVKKGRAKFSVSFFDSKNSTARQGEVYMNLLAGSETIWQSGAIAEKDLEIASELVEISLQAMGFHGVEGRSDYTLDLSGDQ